MTGPPSDRQPDTPRESRGPDAGEIAMRAVCGACNGTADGIEICRWCTTGYQDTRQQLAWARFRARYKAISKTYNFLEETVHDLAHRLDRIEEADTKTNAKALALRGLNLLGDWSSNTDQAIRREAVERLTRWHSEAVDFLQSSGYSAYGPITIPPAADTEPSPR